MNNQKILSLAISFIGYVVFQVFFARKMVLFEVAFCFTYLGFLLSLPYSISRVYLLLIAFGLGLSVDVFYDTLGIHTMACVALAFIRPFLIDLLAARSNVNTDLISEISIRELGVSWFLTYATILVFLHHFILFFVEAGTLSLFIFSIKRVIFSTIFSIITIVIVQYLFVAPQRR